ncbi:response regulator [Arenibacter certesii]|uniref:Response regulatory domain-containing protein n=1 Tax=Arenibacter certesii TaxID=228955 RepID=A0A918J1G2_9FLAO|nr:response regulator [Arenibacter certesii]GGW42383.1 hypothetical protein GCM10007383_28670 [Arenibacter certesii]
MANKGKLMDDYNVDKQQYLLFLVDDDVEDRDFFSMAMNEIEHDVQLTLFSSSEELLEYLSSGKPLPNAIFLDLYMPKIDGEACLSILRGNPSNDDICITIYSNYVDMEKTAQLFQKGANRFLKKPSTYSGLKKVLSRVIASLKNNPSGGHTVFNYSE